jgi:hypothetical protein
MPNLIFDDMPEPQQCHQCEFARFMRPVRGAAEWYCEASPTKNKIKPDYWACGSFHPKEKKQ